MDGERFRDLIGGRHRGIGASTLRGLLRLLEMPYHFVTSARNRLYDFGLKKSHRFDLPIISVGNLTLGGTGKSPMVAWLARYFLDRGLRPGLISRGYGKSKEGVNDEYLELAFRLPMVPHLLDRDRVAAADAFLKRKEPVDLLILDDAFQHRRIARDSDIVLLDASEPFGFEHVFPRGTLRESISGLRRADVVLLSRADRIDAEERGKIQNRVLSIAPEVVWAEVVHRPRSMVALSGDEEGLETIRGRKTLAFCGIGNPVAFAETLRQCGAEVVELIPFPDHHRFTPEDFDRLATAAKNRGVDTILCTMKDLVKIDRSRWSGPSLKAVLIDIGFLSGEERVRRHLENRIDGSYSFFPPETR